MSAKKKKFLTLIVLLQDKLKASSSNESLRVMSIENIFVGGPVFSHHTFFFLNAVIQITGGNFFLSSHIVLEGRNL